MMNRRLLLIIVLQIALLLTIVGKYQYILLTGQVIALKTAPVDPVDPFYGDYVVLNYEIARIDGTRVSHDVTGADDQKEVYVVLEKKANPWFEAVGVYRQKPAVQPNQVVLKGTLRNYDESGSKEMRLDYGIGRYYVTENTGREIEARRNQLSMVEARVSGSGDAVISQLVFN